MTLPAALRAAVEAVHARHTGNAARVTGATPVHGGCINSAATVRFGDGSGVFVKWNAGAPHGMFRAEAEGLEAMRATDTVRVPVVLGWADANADGCPPHLVIEDVTLPRAGFPRCDGDHNARLGRELAAMHRATAPRFGFASDNYIGRTPQPNTPCASWEEFFREHRLLHMIRLLGETGSITPDEALRAEKASVRTARILASVEEPPALVHGDLWGGNVIRDAEGGPVLIDPAVHFAHREVDLAMTELFGGFGPRFRAAYEEAHPTQPGYAERRDIYNAYHLLNHALLFGGGYWSRARSILCRYGG